MLFIDGENMTFRGAAFASGQGITLEPGTWYQPDRFLWIPSSQKANSVMVSFLRQLHDIGVEDQAVRAFYYASVEGTDEVVLNVREALRDLGFSPEVFKKERK